MKKKKRGRRAWRCKAGGRGGDTVRKGGNMEGKSDGVEVGKRGDAAARHICDVVAGKRGNAMRQGKEGGT
ncbi:UNVERIFIED_CONTAM: hypothetical protein Sradi_3958400 [Sesamum radiatum]|uniref:Uncharacterized protein n=1 Tax=Sesamum radiatum TaxID=300843 RepID=A0AAW2PG32_SESRA